MEPPAVIGPSPGESAPAAGAARTRLTLGLLAVAGLLMLFQPGVGAVALIAGLALLWTSPQWGTRHKLLGTATASTVPVLLLLGSLFLAASGIDPMELLLAVALSVAVPAVGAATLLRATRH
ncbi:hypothetical protein GPJ59_30495 [Streptomyces bambusae]|uniref:Phosphatidate cytidylyltransferase n=1 Tax=Streptomyces bambusae TaxID=1550616 RepID=A0ABS6ZEQ6_9ACTN|nr:hypothetical protein [Streptomyces bambusae]